ncbi:cysteine desulfurase family protein [Urbifossiella limnaea]|uniref:Cysteine desulfurase n=1 Tax=Urbifossiella limnaea TaxID=2528023 RepID=A0A517Y3T1_9BACT|nr:aminotransferase class V-fold PLP-dependent enzyme [Urbifossiella limnaea]QDU24354.1 Cysteine desulfurase [Urbifossiella limnaea]
MRRIDLDHNATTPTRPEVWDAVRAAPDGNPSSAHAAGRAARRALDDARERVAAALGCEPDEVTFTGGATEANNLAVFGLAGPGRVVASPLEHPCVAEPLKKLGNVEYLPVTHAGVVEVPAAPADVRFAAVMLANHDTGAVQPVRVVVDALPGVPVLCDAAQAVGKLPVSFRDLGVAALTAAGHKFGGPKGVGLLVLRRGTPFTPTVFGGHQQGGRRPGTEPVPLAVGLALALELAVAELAGRRATWAALRQRFLAALQPLNPVVNSPADGLPNTLNVSFPGTRADLLVPALDLAGVACSAGAACASGSLLPSPVLRAMHLPDDVVRAAVRFSFGRDTDVEAVDEAAGRIGHAVRRLRGNGFVPQTPPGGRGTH